MRSFHYLVTTLLFLQLATTANSSVQSLKDELQEPDLTCLILIPEHTINIQMHKIEDVIKLMKQEKANELTIALMKSFLLLQDQDRKPLVFPAILKSRFEFKECLCSKLANFLIQLDESLTIFEEIKDRNTNKLKELKESYVINSRYCSKVLPGQVKNGKMTTEEALAHMTAVNNLGKRIVSEQKEIKKLNKQIRELVIHKKYINELLAELEV